ncbi:hypothetical protein PACTADRAFT_49796 [Pachysolen tannophilus NRRL Y-2460]|uniref:Uncharacterized protein n=1 Tax=Pachysolen tannophilus NRRL Y-2460 TaxID=669874 RepID=A0A1E4TXH2_PACTA|nr:hypothetical protein PACTADRAFT_49796 [Pachysolen tannophilus NRRL Y-2460]
MKTARPNLTIQLNNSRKNSSLDVTPTNSNTGILTPVDQTLSTPLYPPPNPQYFQQQHHHLHSHLAHQQPTTNQHYYQQQQQQQQQQVQQQQQQQQVQQQQVSGLLEDEFVTPVATRNNSTFSFCSDEEGVMDYSPVSFSNNPVLTRNSSVCSSFAGDLHLPNISFTRNFDNLIISIYQSFLNRPEVTPFNPKFPPSGIVSKVSREVLAKSITEKIQIDYNFKKTEELCLTNNRAYTLTVIRKRLLELCHNSNSNQGSFDDSASINSISQQQQRQQSNGNLPSMQRQNSVSSHHKPSWLHLNNGFTINRLSSTDSLVESVNLPVNNGGNISSQPASRQSSIPRLSHLNSAFSTPPSSLSTMSIADDDFSFEGTGISAPSHNIVRQDVSYSSFLQPPVLPFVPGGSNGGVAMGGNGIINGSSTTPPPTTNGNMQCPQAHQQHLESPFHPTFSSSIANNVNNGSVSSPLNEFAFKNSHPKRDTKDLNGNGNGNANIEDDPLYNATVNRKRDSLIKKRGGR